MKSPSPWLAKNWMALLALIISAASTWFAYAQHRFAKHLAHVHIEPALVSLLDLPKKENPVYIVSNQGDIPVVSFSAS